MQGSVLDELAPCFAGACQLHDVAELKQVERMAPQSIASFRDPGADLGCCLCIPIITGHLHGITVKSQMWLDVVHTPDVQAS